MQKLDALVVGALEVAQMPVTLQDLQNYLPADHIFLELWPQVADTAILHPLQALMIVERMDKALSKPGDVIECGIYQGATSVLMAKLLELRHSDKTLFLCDSFQGLPEPDRQVDASARFEKGAWSASRQEVEARLAHYNVLDRCRILEGWFSDTLPGLDEGQQFCFAYIDADLYTSTVDCLQQLWPRLVTRGAAVFDDYHHPSGGVRRAVDDWMADTGEVIHVGPVSQCTVIRGLLAENAGVECHYLGTSNQKEIVISFDYLRRNRMFCAMINSRRQYLHAYADQFSTFAGLIIPESSQPQ